MNDLISNPAECMRLEDVFTMLYREEILPVEVIGLRATLSCIVRTDQHLPGIVVT